MRAVVTGASGFVGGVLIRHLLERGDTVIAADVHRGPSLEGLALQFAEIDVLDFDSMPKTFDGADVVFHLAAVISITGDPTGIVRRINVTGAGNAASAALEAGVGRFVHCSSVHAFDLEHAGPEVTEGAPRSEGDHAPAYDRSKFEGEEQVRERIRRGLDAVIVNPSGVIGPYDYAPSRMGEFFLQLVEKKIPVNVGGAFDWVDVRDVAAGLIAAAEHGRTGENYLVSGHRHSLKELAALAEEVTGVAAPPIDIPIDLIKGLAPMVAWLTPEGRTPLFTPDSMHALQYAPNVCHHKATRELGYNPRSMRTTVADTYAWFNEHPSSTNQQ